MYNFEFKQPKTISEALTALKSDEAKALAGGQTLIPTMKQRLASPSSIVSLSEIPEMKGICKNDDGSISIGGGTTHADVANNLNIFPGLVTLAENIGDAAVRNRGTIGGSLANNDPAACYPAAALSTGATIVTNAREISADDFFQGMFETALDEGEIILSVRFPVPFLSSYQKFIQPASRFAMVGVFLSNFDNGIRVAVTGASEEGVYRWVEAEGALKDNFSESALNDLSIEPKGIIGDIHASKEYRAHLIKVMTKRAVKSAS
ncbi:MAG: xanthine dehydrogenase family protein subunit M [Paracoccaceae bacterium]|nr:xanthine dehydrogenase family protein subunit M [Paracoccaceae bacterium]